MVVSSIFRIKERSFVGSFLSLSMFPMLRMLFQYIRHFQFHFWWADAPDLGGDHLQLCTFSGSSSLLIW